MAFAGGVLRLISFECESEDTSSPSDTPGNVMGRHVCVSVPTRDVVVVVVVVMAIAREITELFTGGCNVR